MAEKTWKQALDLLDKFEKEGKLRNSGYVEYAIRRDLKTEAERLELFRGEEEERIVKRLRPYESAEAGTSEEGQKQEAVLDQSTLHIKHLLEGSPQLPTSHRELDSILQESTSLKLPVTRECYTQIKAQNSLLAQQCLLATDGSAVPAALTTLLLTPPSPAYTEMNTSIYVSGALGKICSLMEQYSELILRLQVTYNAIESDTSSKAILKGLRPDTLWSASHCTLLFAEDKRKLLSDAIKDLQRKRVKLSKLHYGELQFLIGYAAAEGRFRPYWLGVEVTDIHEVGNELNLYLLGDRVKWLQYLVMLYRLADVMAKTVPHVTGRLRLFEAIKRKNGTNILVLDDGIEKTIKKFDRYCAEFGTSLEVMKIAYEAAATAAADAAHNGEEPFMNRAQTGPEVTRSSVYKVRTFPLGYSRRPTTVEDARAIATACCKTAAALHAAGINGRDFRLENCVCLSAPSGDNAGNSTEKHAYMCIDLEGAAFEGTTIPPGFLLAACNAPGVLDNDGKYTSMSDMVEIGMMVEQALVAASGFDGAAKEFVMALKKKQLTAEQALQHLWFREP